jgi:outer membrane protein assembly factor BamB
MQSRRALALIAAAVLAPAVCADDWPQWMGPERDGVWRETGLIDRFADSGPKVLWRVPVEGGYAGPAVAAGRVYVTDYAASGDKTPASMKRNELFGNERVLCFNARDGKLIWKHEYACAYKVSYPAGPRCTPTVRGGKVYVLGTMGDLLCLDAVDGRLIWKKDFKKDYQAKTPIWGFCGHPLVDGQRLFCVVGGKDSVAVAFDKDTGQELWRALSAREPGYCPPTLIQAGGKRQLLIWHAEALNGLDPDTGKLYWSMPLAPGYGMSIMAPRQAGDYLFAGGNANVAALLRLDRDRPAVTEVWRGRNDTAVYPINSTPFLEDGTIYGVDQTGALRAVDLATGKRLWQTFQATGGRGASTATAFLIKNGPRFVLVSDTGHLIFARLSPKSYEEVSRVKILEPTGTAFGRTVVWSYPAFANRCVFARNDKELVCVSLAAE